MNNIVETHPHYLFVYGTLKSGHGNNALLVQHRSRLVGPAVTGDKYLLNDGFPYVWEHKMAKPLAPYFGNVKGELWRVTDAGLEACDRLEGHPRHYKRTPISVNYGTASHPRYVTAGIYLAQYGIDSESDLQKPDEDGILEWGRDRPLLARNFQRKR